MKKILVLGVIAVLLSAGLVLASCDDGACCSADDFKKLAENGTIPPDCCVEAMAKVGSTLDYGCCESAVKEFEKS